MTKTRKHVKFYLTQERSDALNKIRDLEGHMPYTKILDLAIDRYFRYINYSSKKKKELLEQLESL